MMIEQIKCYWIVIEGEPGDERSQEHFDFHCYNDNEAQDYAKRVARLCGPRAEVKEVKRV